MRNERHAREIEHHRSIADRADVIWNWDSPSGRRRARRRAELFVELAGLGKGALALELGCGTGIFLDQVAESGVALRGIDLSIDLLAHAKRRIAGRDNVRVVCGNAERMPFPDREFDAVYGSSVLHHLDLLPALREAYRVLKPGGRVVFAEPNILNPQVAVMFHLGMTKHYFGVSPDEMAFSRFHARSVLRDAGFVQIRVDPFDFLHPATPAGWLDKVAAFGRRLEGIPLVREIAGSLLMQARRPE
jgi:ubiquinone/menaquinone biosynthesis C-methylase UbiE